VAVAYPLECAWRPLRRAGRFRPAAKAKAGPVRSRILVVGRDVASRARLARALQAAGHRVELAESAAQARRLRNRGIALAVLAEHAPDSDRLRADLEGAIGVVVVHPSADTARGKADEDAALLARVAEALQAAPTERAAGPVLCFAGYRLDVAGRSLVSPSGQEVPLTRGEYGLLLAFVQRPGRVLSRDQLLDAMAGRHTDAYDRSIDMLVVRLRRKIEPNPRPTLILTIAGSGYKFASAVHEASEARAAPEPAAASPDTPASGSERRYLTVLSAELIPVAGGSLPGDPEALRGLIETYRRDAAALLAEHGGRVAPGRLRDLVAYFGYPKAEEHAAERAIHAGLALARRRATDGNGRRDGLAVRIGIASGVVVADPAGEVLGTAPSEAALLRGLAEPGEVIVAASTRRLTGAMFAFRSSGPITVNGAPAPVSAWEALAPSAVASRSEALFAEPMTSLVAREEELDLLLRAWGRAKAGEGRLVLLTGEAGIGKSRLLAALADALATEPHTELRYFGSPLHQESSLHPVIARLERAADFVRANTAEERLRKLEASLASGEPSPEDFALIAALLSVPVGERYPTLNLSPQQRKERTFAALTRRLDALARKNPVLILAEDAQWADPTSLELLDVTLDRLAGLPVLLVISYRPDFAAPWIGRADSSLITLGRLDRNQSAALVRQVTGASALAPELLDRVVAQAEGVPLFLEELTKAVLEAAPGERSARRAIPGTLQASLMARLDRLPAAKEFTQIAAAIGREFPHALLAAVADLAQAPLARGLQELIASGLAFRRGVPPDAVYSFRHALVQDLAYGTLVKSRRRDIHRRIGEALRDQLPDRAESEPEVVAHHFTEAGLTEPAVEWWGKAGDLALRRSAFAEAIAHLERALALTGTPDAEPAKRCARLRLQIAYGNALRMARGFGAPEVTAAFAHALDISATAAEMPERFSAYYGLWTGSYGRAELLPMLRLAEAFLHDAQSRPESGEAATAHRVYAMTCWFRGEFLEAERHLERSLTIHDRDRDRELAFRFGLDVGVAAMADLALVLWPLGATDRAHDLAEAAVAHAMRDRHIPSLAYAHAYAATTAMLSRDRERAAPHAGALLELAAEHGMPLWLALGTFLRAWVSSPAGDRAAAAAAMRESIAAMQAHQRRIFTPLVSTLVAETESEAGRPEKGLAIVDAQLASIEETGQRWFLAEALRARGEMLLGCGQDLAAERALARAIDVARSQAAKSFELRAAIRLARHWIRTGRCAEARAMLAPIHAGFAEGLQTADLKEARLLLEGAAGR
jgi:DNA-binding response OmpR family regulator/class 3 adenylate cyclase/predicted ATPase